MADTMIDRLARVADERALYKIDEFGCRIEVGNWPEVARAVIAEMRDIDVAGVMASAGNPMSVDYTAHFQEVWQSAIDAILEEKRASHANE